MTNPTEIETVQVTEVVEDHHKPSLKERIVDTLTGHSHHEHKECEHPHQHNDCVDKMLLTAENPVMPGVSIPGHVGGQHEFGAAVVGIPHEAPHNHVEGEEHHHRHHHEDKEDRYQKYGDKLSGIDLNAAGGAIHHPVK